MTADKNIQLKYDEQFKLFTLYKLVAADSQPATFLKQKAVGKQRWNNMNGRGRETGCTSLHYLCVVSENGNGQSTQWGSNAVVAGTDVAKVEVTEQLLKRGWFIMRGLCAAWMWIVSGQVT